MKKTVFAVSILLVTGCTTVTEAGYYWGNYSQTLYEYNVSPSDETLSKHASELEKIVAESLDKGLKVPPGIYAELGYIKEGRGDLTEALKLYESELLLYPESEVFLERLSERTE